MADKLKVALKTTKVQAFGGSNPSHPYSDFSLHEQFRRSADWQALNVGHQGGATDVQTQLRQWYELTPGLQQVSEHCARAGYGDNCSHGDGRRRPFDADQRCADSSHAALNQAEQG